MRPDERPTAETQVSEYISVSRYNKLRCYLERGGRSDGGCIRHGLAETKENYEKEDKVREQINLSHQQKKTNESLTGI